jgi:hypothetical protein
MPFPDLQINSALTALAADCDWGSIHTAYSTTGASEVSGGSYARLDLTSSFAAAASAAIASNADKTWTIPSGGVSCKFLGFWSAITTGTFRGMIPLGSTVSNLAVAFNTDDYFYSDGHGFVDTDTVVVMPTVGTTAPGGITIGTIYFVVSSATDRFKLSATSGGAAITITTAANVIVNNIAAVDLTAAGGTLKVTSGNLILTGLG